MKTKKTTYEELFKKLSENNDDAFWIASDTEILYTNSAFEKIWGFSRDEI